MRILVSICLIVITISDCFGQQQNSIYGKYVKPDSIYPQLNESIILKGDKTFEYFRRAAFTEFKVKGFWLIQDGYLSLNSVDSAVKSFEVKEAFKKNIHADSIKLKILYFDNTTPHCTVVINEGDKEAEARYTDVYGEILLPKKIVRSITVYSVIKHKTYLIRSCKSNYFELKLNSNRILNKEKWLLIGEQIVPIGLDGDYTNYTLVKQH